jgi:acyl-CoA thioester hydrolase
MIDLSLFRFSHPIEIRFSDLDQMAHVNHAKYFTYMEMARVLYVRDVLGWPGGRDPQGAIMARIDCDFRTPLALGDPIRVYARVSRIGDKSFDFEHVIVREIDQAEAARGVGVLVAYDYLREQSIPVPEEWRARMIAFEPGLRQPTG